MIKTYRKTATITAEQFDGSDEMADKYELIDIGTMIEAHHSPELYLMGATKKVVVGDWIITNKFNSHALLTNEEFRQMYAELPVIPKAVADWIEKCKQNDQAIASALDQTAMSSGIWDYFRKYRTRTQWISMQNTFARAWLDGYQIED
ncbi:DUF1642 domain-containing protein [Levilactobacillus hammesii]|uniref:DUF1642 domain-containing protein n=1 Tax=Levilactobacillus hammesii DSM 16381 TaxID=1423753 RepID=A0A0R1UQR7_9LACO|nr:DUF1642 domain-containing protein [Levilactobacillus hammesii]KRL95552.1 hypothetical protein FD28_GL002523 [Levilactobacillus hammesii DSM 16381]